MNVDSKLDKWIFNSFKVTAEGLGLLRIFSSLFILFFLVPGSGIFHLSYLSSMPSDFFAPPPGPYMILNSFPPFVVFAIILSTVYLSLIAMLFGYKTRVSSIIAGLSILILQGLVYSVGKINHELLIAVLPIVMAFSNWGNRFSIDSIRINSEKREPESWPLTLLALIIGFMMFTAGFPKILGGWLDPSSQAAYGHLLNQVITKEREAFFAAYFAANFQPVLWEILDWLVIIFEVGFLFAVFKSKWFKLFLCFAIVFHFSTLMTLNIAFIPNILAYAVFLNWERIYQGFSKFLNSEFKLGIDQSDMQFLMSASTGFLVIFSFIQWLDYQDLILEESELMLHEVLFLATALLITIYLTLRYILRPDKKESFE